MVLTHVKAPRFSCVIDGNRGQQMPNEVWHASYLLAKWQMACTAKKEATLCITVERMPQLLVNAELAHARIAIA